MAIFDTKSIISLRGMGVDERLTISCFNGKSYISLFSPNLEKPISIWLSDTIKYFLKKAIIDVLKNKEANVGKTLIIPSYDYNTNKSSEFEMSIKRDTNRKLLWEIVHPDIPGNNIMQFPFYIPFKIQIKDENIDEVTRSEYGAKIFVDLLDRKLTMAEIISRDMEEMAKFKEAFKQRQQSSSQNFESTPSIETEEVDVNDEDFLE